MDKDAETIKHILLDAIKERRQEQHQHRVSEKVSLIGSAGGKPPLFINAEQRMSIQQLMMEFYRVMQSDKPQIRFSNVSQKFMQRFKVRSLEFLTVERFDEVILELLNAISSYHDMNFDGAVDDFAGFQVIEEVPSRQLMFARRTQRNIANYLLEN
jgi:hypothetical protein